VNCFATDELFFRPVYELYSIIPPPPIDLRGLKRDQVLKTIIFLSAKAHSREADVLHTGVVQANRLSNLIGDWNAVLCYFEHVVSVAV